MPLPRYLRQPLQKSPGFPHDHLGNYFVMKPAEQVVIAREVAAVEKRNGEFSIVGVVAVALTQCPRRRTQLQPQVPQFLREAANLIFESLLRGAISKKKKQIDIGIWKQPAAPESPCSHQGEVGRPCCVGRDNVAPEPSENIFHQPGSLRYGRAPVPRHLEFLLNARRFVAKGTSEFAHQ